VEVAGLAELPNYVVALTAVPGSEARQFWTSPFQQGAHATACGPVPARDDINQREAEGESAVPVIDRIKAVRISAMSANGRVIRPPRYRVLKVVPTAISTRNWRSHREGRCEKCVSVPEKALACLSDRSPVRCLLPPLATADTAN
jgi:hypothetical protein